MSPGALVLAWAPVREGRGFSPAVRSLAKRRSPGVYVVREAGTVVYVGRCVAKAGLYGTVTRHFQRWGRRRGRRDWTGQHGETPGLTYDGAACEVAIVFARGEGEANALEAALIDRLNPRDNERPEAAALEAAPF